MKPDYFVSKLTYIVPANVCMDAILDAKQLANDLYKELRMLPIGVTYVSASDVDRDRQSILGYDATVDSCMIEIQINVCSKSRSSFATQFEAIVVNKYNGTGHWAYLWHDYNLWYLHREQQLAQFESIRSELDPNGTFINKLYANLFTKSLDERTQIESEYVTELYPKHAKIVSISFFVIGTWFAIVYILYLIGSYYRVLPFLDERAICLCCNNFNGEQDEDEDGEQRCCMNLMCCNDMNELDDLIEREQKLLEMYAESDKYDQVIEDLIDVEVLDPSGNDYVTITVTFKTAFWILMSDENYREFQYRDIFAVSRGEELNERYETLGEEFTWKSIYPRQCLFFSACSLSVAMLLIAIIEASLS